MNEEEALLAAIAARPLEDAPRLIYADWLEEHAGDSPDHESVFIRAEFIRLQCEIKKYENLPSSEQQGYAELYRRQDHFLTHHREDLLGSLGKVVNPLEVVFDRGFAAELRLDAARFLDHASEIARFLPIPSVILEVFEPFIPLLCTCPQRGLVVRIEAQQRLNWYDDVSTEGEWSRFFNTIGWSELQDLYIFGSQIGDEGIRELTEFSAAFPKLTHLRLHATGISDVGVIDLTTSILWPRLEHLELISNPISDEGAIALADAPPTKIRYLALRGTGIGQHGQQRVLRRKGWKVDLF